MPVCLTPILTAQKYPFLSLFLFHRHSVQLAPCGPLPSNKKEDHTIFLRQLRVLEREMKALQVLNSTQTTLERFFVSKIVLRAHVLAHGLGGMALALGAPIVIFCT